MPDAARRSTLNVPMRLISMILRNRSRSCGSPLRLIVRSAQPTPAQWMHVRSGASSTAAATAAFIGLLVGDVGLRRTGRRCRPRPPRPSSASRSTTTTCAPSAARRRPVASPIPDAPPVTSADVFSSDMAAQSTRVRRDAGRMHVVPLVSVSPPARRPRRRRSRRGPRSPTSTARSPAPSSSSSRATPPRRSRRWASGRATSWCSRCPTASSSSPR